ncbi:MAG: cadherin-like beta sandwich domain-containing protein [Candidatus Pristimantibacillus sp.]
MIKWDGNSASPSVGRLSFPQGIAVYGNDLYIADTNANRVLKFDASTFSAMSNPVVWSGDLDPDTAVDATINRPFGIAADSSGVYIGNNANSSTYGKIIKLKTDGSALIKTITSPRGFGLHSDGYLYVAVNGNSSSLVTRFDSSLNEDSVYFTGNSIAIAPTNIGFDHTGALYLSTYAQAAGYDIIYDTVWKQSLGSPDNRLSGLTASGITLSPSPFSSNTQDYTASVASSVTLRTVTPVLSDSTASVTVKGVSVTSGSASSPIELSKGDNTIPVVVTAINGASRTYTIKVTRAPYTDATLSGLTASPGSLNETFAAGTLAYTANVANSVSSIDVTPTVNNSRATVKVNNATATSGSASTVSSLSVGPNPITVSVTAEDGTTSNDYTITVMRAPSSVATLGSLTVSPGALNETFASGTLSYTTNVANSVGSISVTPTVSDSIATLTVNGTSSVSGSVYGPISLVVGANTITVVVTAQDGVTTKPYTIVVTRAPSSTAMLSALTISPGSFNESFASGTTSYTASVANNVAAISVTPTISDSTASLKVNGTVAVSGSVYGPVPLAVGANTITVAVTAQDGTTTTPYSIVVTRASSSVATLVSLTVSTGSLNETFASAATSYTASVANGVAAVSVTPTVSDSAATLTVNGHSSVSGAVYGPIPLSIGANTVTVVVTAQDGVTTKPYTIVVTRAPSSTAMLSALTISPGLFNESFASGTTSYTANVANNVAAISVTPTVTDSTSSLKVNGAAAVSGAVYGPIPLSIGANTVTVVVTAQDGTTTPYSIVVMRAPSSAAMLSALKISPGMLNEPFTSEMLAYTASVEHNVSSINVTPMVIAESHATLTINGVPAANGSDFGPIALNTGSNTVTVIVTAQDGVTLRSYRLDIFRTALNKSSGPAVNAADLISLSLLAYEKTLTLSPAFKGDTLSYTAETTAKKVQLTAKTLYKDASVSLLGNKLQEEVALELLPGDNTIELQVTHPSGPLRTYTITIHRSTAGLLPEQPSGDSGTAMPTNDIAGNWAEAEIRKAVAEGWVAGYPDGSFHPEREVTRAEFVQLLGRSLGWKEPEVWNMPVYADIDDIGLWARPAISMAVQQGIINGYEDGSFRPARPLTRAEMTMLIIRTLGLPVEMDQSTSFADNSSIPPWSLPYIAEAAKRGLVNGLENNRFEPNGTATRAEAVVILTRLLNRK